MTTLTSSGRGIFERVSKEISNVVAIMYPGYASRDTEPIAESLDYDGHVVLVDEEFKDAVHAYLLAQGGPRGRHVRRISGGITGEASRGVGSEVVPWSALRVQQASITQVSGDPNPNIALMAATSAVVTPTTEGAVLPPLTADPTLVVDIPLPPPEPPRIRTENTEFLRFQQARPATWRLLIVAVMLVAVGAVVVWSRISHGGAKPAPPHVAVTSSKATGTVVTLTRGPINLSQLRTSLTRSGHSNLISSVPGGAVEVNANIVVGTRATFDITRAALLLFSDAEQHVQILARGGTLNFADDTISSWTKQGDVDTDTIAGRANLVATGRGTELNLTNCWVVGLGTAQDPGISWRDGASGSVQSSRFSQDWRGAFAYKSGQLTIVNSSFSNSQEDGALLLDPGTGSSVSDSTFANNTQSGLEVEGTVHNLNLVSDTADHNGYAGLLTQVTTGEVEAIHGLFYDNQWYGISVGGGQFNIDEAKIWANQTGIYIHGGDNSVTDSDLSANEQDGIFITGSDTVVTANTDRFDHNSVAGLWAAAGRIQVTSGLFDENVTGIRIARYARRFFQAEGNDITNNSKDGVSLDVGPGIQIQGNVIDDNGDSGISTNKTYKNLKTMLEENTLSNNQIASRIRASD
jgi:hypothetical protein